MTPISRRSIVPPAGPAPVGPYSPAVALDNGLVFVSGQVPIDPATGTLVPGDVRAQTHQVLANLDGVLTAAGASAGHVVKTTVFLRDMADFAAMNEVYSEYFKGPTPPARSTIEVARLPKDAAVEIEAVAWV